MHQYPNAPGARREGTSVEAAESMKSKAETIRHRLLRYLETPPYLSDGFTVHEAAARLGETVPAVQPRFSELLATGHIRDSGKVRKNASGRNATVWLAVLPNDQLKMF